MGCCFACLTKKSRDNRIKNRGLTKQPLIDEDRNSSGRGMSLQRDNYYEASAFKQSASYTSNEGAGHDSIGLYEPPQSEGPTTRKVVGKSLVDPPSLNDLTKADWLMKRGHMVRNWRKRYFVLDDGEIKYFEKRDDKTGKGINVKGQVHLLGATCELKLNVEDSAVIEIIGRQGEKDLLLKFNSRKEAYEWYDAIHWTVYRWNVNSITSGEETVDTEKWYMQQLENFEVAFQELTAGCKFNKHGISMTGKMVTSLCSVQANREDVCLTWCTTSQSESPASRGMKSQMRIIPMSDIVDVIYGHYADDDIPMLSIATKAHTLDLQIIDDAVADIWIKALSDVLLFLAIPVPRGCRSVSSTDGTSSKSNRKNNRKGSAFS